MVINWCSHRLLTLSIFLYILNTKSPENWYIYRLKWTMMMLRLTIKLKRKKSVLPIVFWIMNFWQTMAKYFVWLFQFLGAKKACTFARVNIIETAWPWLSIIDNSYFIHFVWIKKENFVIFLFHSSCVLFLMLKRTLLSE